MSDQTAPQPKLKIAWLLAIAAALVLFSIIGNYSSRMTFNTADYDQDRAVQRKATLAQVQAEESKQINPVDDSGKPTAEWVDQDKGVIRIPIEQAMLQEVDTIKAQTCGPGCEIAPAAPAPTASTTNAAPANAAPAPATNAPPAKPAAPAPPAGKPGAKPAPPAKPKT